MRRTSPIAIAIQLTLLGCADNESEANDTSETPSDCGPGATTTPFEFDAWPLTPEAFAELSETAQQAGLIWDDLDQARRCEVVCAYADGVLDGYLDSYFNGGYTELEFTSCTLSLELELDQVVGGELSCVGDLTTGAVCLGRRPLGWPSSAAAETDGETLDRFARLEQVSITAFIELAAQLEALAAPTELIDRCRSAAGDERRHVELLVGCGARPPRESPTHAGPETPLVTIALHNATEGCVIETWAALLAAEQAQHAASERIRGVFGEIARDEAEHADLAWDLHRWLCTRLDSGDAARVEAARYAMLERLPEVVAAQARAVPAATRRELGLPDPDRARALARGFGSHLANAA